ncbi:HIV Tat-specific factor 1-like protein [Yarrowia sp. C11]|nr:HIV Tat-specific factor 1-like protein [Yarrowia sp. C11]
MSDNQLAEIAAIAPLPPAGGKPEHVTYSTIKGTYLYENETDGTLFEFDHVTRGWRLIEEEVIATEEPKEEPGDELEAALVAGETEAAPGSEKEEPTEKDQAKLDKKAVQEQLKKKRKEVIEERKNAKKAQKGDKPPQKAIYVSGLPSAATNDDLVDIFQKYGVLAEDVYTGKKKARVYVDEQGQGKGDGLVVFFKPESVKLAVDMLHNQPVYIGDKMVTINVQPAVFDKEKSGTKSKEETDSGPNYSEEAKAKAKRKYTQLQQKLNDWGEEEESKRAKTESRERLEKVVTLKHVFTIEELQEDVDAEMDIKEDIYSGCGAIGTVRSVTLYDLEPEGVATVKFERASDAAECVEKMNGRFFGGQKLEAYIDYEETRWRKSKDRGVEDDEDEKERLDRFGKWLED